jgi:hypothetical protein
MAMESARAPDIIIGSWCGKKFRPEKLVSSEFADVIKRNRPIRKFCSDPVRHSHCRRSPTNSRCLSIDTRSCWKLFHTFGDDFGQLHHLLSQLAVFRNIALNAIAVGV